MSEMGTRHRGIASISAAALLLYTLLVGSTAAHSAPPSAAASPAAAGAQEPLKIKTILPESADPGAILTLIFSRQLSGEAGYTVTFDGIPSPDVSLRGRYQLRVQVPPNINPGFRPLVVIEGNQASPPAAFEVLEGASPQAGASPPAGPRRLSWALVAEVAGGLLLIGALSYAVWTARRSTRDRQRISKELDFLRFQLGREELPSSQTPPAASSHPAASPIAPPAIPDELVEACASGECVLFAGSGLSVQAGYATWAEALRAFVERKNAVVSPPSSLDVEQLLRGGQLGTLADFIVQSAPRKELLGVVNDLYGTPRDLPPIFNALRGIPFGNVLTTSWDSSLERAFAVRTPTIITPRDSYQLPQLLADQFCIVKLYGGTEAPESILLTRDEYRRALDDNQLYAKYLTSLSLSKPHFYVGVGLATIEEHLASTQARSRSSQTHYAFLGEEPGLELKKEVLERKYNIRLLTFTPTPGWPEVAAFVEALRAAVSKRAPKRPRPTVRPATLNAVRLVNIGPYRELSLTLDPHWNVLLGNNGCGKSTVLRAIALGLCGDDVHAAPFAQRLLRINENRGLIELTVGKEVYKSELTRVGDRVQLVCRQVTPVTDGRWVVLGFPPLRGVSLWNPQGPSADGAAVPQVADVLPVISGAPDTRLDSIKQWAVNIDARSTPGGGVTSSEAARNEQLRGSFFRLLGEFTPGTKLEWNGVDRRTWQVLVTTDDGAVPIEQVSQGMSSIVAWVGTLLQRMYEIHRDSDNPEAEAALVLVDEIDAHLHPEWQQAIVPLIKTKFPNLQIVATTHSPLLVAGMKRDEVRIAQRGEGDKACEAFVVEPPLHFEGMRADQILTSPLFGLATTRSSGTRRDIDEYSELLGKSQRTEDEEQRFMALKESLRSILAVGETTVERRVEDAVHKVLKTLTSPENLIQPPGAGVTSEDALEVKKQLATILGREEAQPLGREETQPLSREEAQRDSSAKA